MSTPPAGRRRADRLIGLTVGVVLALVALSVALLGDRSDRSDGGDGGEPGDRADAAAVTGARTVAVQLADMRISPATITVPAGTRLVLDVTNTDSMRHDLYVGGGPRTPLLTPGEHATLSLGPVTRTVQGWCTVPGHKAAGMVMSIRVTGPASSPADSPAGSTPTHPGGMPMPVTPSGASPTIDFAAAPGPNWKPYDATLVPAPGTRVHRATFTIRDTATEVAPGVRQTLWTYNGTAPGPILHGHVGDTFLVTIVNDGNMAHGIDFHAGAVDPDGPMRPIAPGQSLTYRFTAHYAGAWLYHCSTMPMSLHTANGMFGAVIIDPPDVDDADQQFVLIQSELYLGAQNGVADEAKIDAKTPDAIVFNGYVDQYDHAPITVRAGERVRVWVVDAGPELPTSFHVVGAPFDTVFKEGAYLLRPGNPEHGAAQTLDLAPAQGGFVEFVPPAPGHYAFLDHALVDAEHGAHGVIVARK